MRNALLVLVIMLGIVATGAGVAEFVLVVSVVIAIVVMLLVNHDGRLLLDDDRASLDQAALFRAFANRMAYLLS